MLSLSRQKAKSEGSLPERKGLGLIINQEFPVLTTSFAFNFFQKELFKLRAQKKEHTKFKRLILHTSVPEAIQKTEDKQAKRKWLLDEFLPAEISNNQKKMLEFIKNKLHGVWPEIQTLLEQEKYRLPELQTEAPSIQTVEKLLEFFSYNHRVIDTFLGEEEVKKNDNLWEIENLIGEIKDYLSLLIEKHNDLIFFQQYVRGSEDDPFKINDDFTLLLDNYLTPLASASALKVVLNHLSTAEEKEELIQRFSREFCTTIDSSSGEATDFCTTFLPQLPVDTWHFFLKNNSWAVSLIKEKPVLLVELIKSPPSSDYSSKLLKDFLLNCAKFFSVSTILNASTYLTETSNLYFILDFLKQVPSSFTAEKAKYQKLLLVHVERLSPLIDASHKLLPPPPPTQSSKWSPKRTPVVQTEKSLSTQLTAIIKNPSNVKSLHRTVFFLWELEQRCLRARTNDPSSLLPEEREALTERLQKAISHTDTQVETSQSISQPAPFSFSWIPIFSLFGTKNSPAAPLQTPATKTAPSTQASTSTGSNTSSPSGKEPATPPRTIKP